MSCGVWPETAGGKRENTVFFPILKICKGISLHLASNSYQTQKDVSKSIFLSNYVKLVQEKMGVQRGTSRLLFLVLNVNGGLFPLALYLSPVDQDILKGRSAWKYVFSVEAPKEKQQIPQPLLNKKKSWVENNIKEFESRKTAITRRNNLFAFICTTTCREVSY